MKQLLFIVLIGYTGLMCGMQRKNVTDLDDEQRKALATVTGFFQTSHSALQAQIRALQAFERKQEERENVAAAAVSTAAPSVSAPSMPVGPRVQDDRHERDSEDHSAEVDVAGARSDKQASILVPPTEELFVFGPYEGSHGCARAFAGLATLFVENCPALWQKAFGREKEKED